MLLNVISKYKVIFFWGLFLLVAVIDGALVCLIPERRCVVLRYSSYKVPCSCTAWGNIRQRCPDDGDGFSANDSHSRRSWHAAGAAVPGPRLSRHHSLPNWNRCPQHRYSPVELKWLRAWESYEGAGVSRKHKHVVSNHSCASLCYWNHWRKVSPAFRAIRSRKAAATQRGRTWRPESRPNKATWLAQTTLFLYSCDDVFL